MLIIKICCPNKRIFEKDKSDIKLKNIYKYGSITL